MRMVHYYAALAVPASLLLLATAWTGAFHDGTQKHVALGLFTAILCVAVHTLLILFMIVTGRVLKAATQSRRLGPEFLAELNVFFARREAYPLALGAAALATATAVLGYGRYIGVPIAVHVVVAVAMLCVNLWALSAGVRTLLANQRLVDRAQEELDRVDRERGTESVVDAEPAFALGPRARRLVFAASAWLPYLYWGLVVWRGDFARVGTGFLVGTAAVSAAGVVAALRSRPG